MARKRPVKFSAKALSPQKGTRAERLQVFGETYITTRAAAEILGLGIVRVQQLAREKWPAVKLSATWLIDYDSVMAYVPYAQPWGDGVKPLENKMNYVVPLTNGVLKTRPGVLTTMANIVRAYNLSWAAVIPLLQRGLPARRMGTEILIYEDDWDAFIRNEWERPRLKRAFSLPKPKGVTLGPIIPSPMRGLASDKRRKGQYAGWTDKYVSGLEKGKPPKLREIAERPRKRDNWKEAPAKGYWVYERPTGEGRAVVHRAECPYCQAGKGKGKRKNDEKSGTWLGPFKDLAKAQRAAGKTGRPDWDCGYCLLAE